MKMRAFRRSLKTLGAVLLTAGTLTALKPAVSFAAYSYPSAAKYTAGDAEIKKPVRNLDVDWVSGQITVAYHSADTVELHETSKKQISKDMQMRWWLDGDTLRVRYAKPGFHTLFARNKQLTITLPEDIVFDEVSMTATSADFLIPALQTDTLKLHVISGDIEAAADARNAAVRANCTSAGRRLRSRPRRPPAKSGLRPLRPSAFRLRAPRAKLSSGQSALTNCRPPPPRAASAPRSAG